MPTYLISATGFRRSEHGTESYAGKSFTFEVSLNAPWNDRNVMPLRDLAAHECYRLHGFWPKHPAQIDHVIEVQQPLAVALQQILDLVGGAEKNDVWDHVHATDILTLIPTTPDGYIDLPVLTEPDWAETERIKNEVQGVTAPSVEFDDDNLV